MAKPDEGKDLDSMVIPLGDVPAEGAFDEWLALVHGDGYVELSKSAAELVAEARAEAEWPGCATAGISSLRLVSQFSARQRSLVPVVPATPQCNPATLNWLASLQPRRPRRGYQPPHP